MTHRTLAVVTAVVVTAGIAVTPRAAGPTGSSGLARLKAGNARFVASPSDALPFDAAIVDIMMPGLDGIATLEELRRIDEDLAVIIITAYGSIESAISAMKGGAFDYVTKPFQNEEVLNVVGRAMERRQLDYNRLMSRENGVPGKHIDRTDWRS